MGISFESRPPCGFRWLVGYGLDHDDLYRNLPYVAALDDAELTRGPAG
jgi:hypothetical protein